MIRYLSALLLICSFLACQQIHKDYAGVTVPKDSPKYTVQPSRQNTKP